MYHFNIPKTKKLQSFQPMNFFAKNIEEQACQMVATWYPRFRKSYIW